MVTLPIVYDNNAHCTTVCRQHGRSYTLTFSTNPPVKPWCHAVQHEAEKNGVRNHIMVFKVHRDVLKFTPWELILG